MENENVIICRCEEVTFKEICDTLKQYNCSSREVKLRTRAAMGYCGGRSCRSFVDTLVAEFSRRPRADDVQLKYRPPVRPMPFKTLGGE
ncbi:BFD-like [2Fe-2S] binding protein [Scopulibacillus darangshiensis]|uniref:BFD-like [2Fe-2S] binding protein n=1 Tax=Scopulibacillus darangshiensis TaxID=442528 RepID=A0A4R2NPT4_9BACL|nr:(2Fe-2S)-binding protein [Scopulibacillus darangshiensis]TCP23451.1 BFD-like [2Fe-2S] binding protein [Scopulibacillus darangshiensis]